MGNNSTKEQRHPESYSSPTYPGSSNSRLPSSPSSPGLPGPGTHPQSSDRYIPPSFSSRSARPGRADSGSTATTGGEIAAGLDARKETKQERDARRAEKERIARQKERERSVREEGVDGGFVVTMGVYTGPEDFNKAVVRQLMIERRLAPFWRGLNDYSSSWKEHQQIAAARGEPIPSADDAPPQDPRRPTTSSKPDPRSSDQNLNSLTVPITSRSQSYGSDSSTNLSPAFGGTSLPTTSPVSQPATSSSSPFRPRSKTLASLTTLTKNSSQGDMKLREIQLPKDPYVEGRPIESYLYKDASECPICFLYYPPYLNKTRCCDQPICSECFVQIKRPDPHPPEHADPTAPPPEPTADSQNQGEGALVSEPAACPFCVQPEFGITYDPPAFRRGLAYANNAGGHPIAKAASAMSSSTSVSSITGTGGSGTQSPIAGNRRRTTSLSANAPSVITTDKIRPDWAQKLSSARAHAARRSAAATALHTAAYLMGGAGADGRGLSGFRRRGAFMRGTGSGSESPGSGARTPRGDHRMTLGQISALSSMADRSSNPPGRSDTNWFGGSRGEEGNGAGQPSGRSRMEDLEDMMMMEAIRLSLAAEDERKKKEDKESKKDAKKKDKESKKAEKAARKAGFASGNSLEQSSVFQGGVSGSSNTSSVALGQDKGKEIDRTGTEGANDPRSAIGSGEPSPTFKMDLSTPEDTPPEPAATPEQHLQNSRARIQSGDAPSGTGPSRPSHLRQVSNTSSASSILDSPVGSFKGSSLGAASPFDTSRNASDLNFNPGSAQDSAAASEGAGTEPMFNFSSLAAMVGEEDKPYSVHLEQQTANTGEQTQGKSETLGGLPPLVEAVPGHEEGPSQQPLIPTESRPQEPQGSGADQLEGLRFDTGSGEADDSKNAGGVRVIHTDSSPQTSS
ncbi:MAG: hypothetical protein M4579_004650 [Chaenotheca gracillima]|nr:MAG: hypothetical protein M4579_004650 [Chaenotheca gracillima]